MASMPDAVGKDGRTKAGRQFQSAVIARACGFRGMRMVRARGLSGNRRAVHGQRAEQRDDGPLATTGTEYLHWQSLQGLTTQRNDAPIEKSAAISVTYYGRRRSPWPGGSMS